MSCKKGVKVCFSTLVIFIVLVVGLKCDEYRPVFGVISVPLPFNSEDYNKTVILTSYPKWIEAAGGRTIAISPGISDNELDELFEKINGLIWHGGNRDLKLDGGYEMFSLKTLNRIKEYQDKKNISIPLFLSCQGFELLNIIYANSTKILTEFDANDYTSGLIFNDKEIRKSRLFSFFDEEDFYALRYLNSTYHLHGLGTTKEDFDRIPSLKNDFTVTSFGEGRDKGHLSIETYEAKQYPIYGVQFHPEKVPYEYNPNYHNIERTSFSIKISMNFALFLVYEARKNTNTNKFSKEDEDRFPLINIYKDVSVINGVELIEVNLEKKRATGLKFLG